MPRTKKAKTAEKVVKKVEKAVKEEIEDLGVEVGKVSHYFDKIGVAVVELTKALGVDDLIRVKGTTTDFKQKVKSMQVEHKAITKAKKGDAVGMKVEQEVREHDKVYVVK
jgi:putative protease